MKIRRKGARADHGMKYVELKLASMKWNPTAEALDVSFAGAASDFSTPARHFYYLRFDPAEQAKWLDMLVEAGTSMDAEEFAAEFKKALPSLFKLQAMASGLKIAA
jgi:hypothetical protein